MSMSKKIKKQTRPSRQKCRSVSVTEFKAKALRYFEETARTKEGIIITKHGKPLAQVLPFDVPAVTSLKGSLQGIAQIVGDIVNFDTSDEWEVLRD